MCRCVDPAPERWEKGNLDVQTSWYRLAADITHVRGVPYMTLIDCGLSQFSIWTKLKNETADTVAVQMLRIFRERGPPAELITDNGPCFKSSKLNSMLKSWNVHHIFSCAYRASGNGIIERNHRTIKRMAARSGGSIEDMVYWYNNSPNVNGNVPFVELYTYSIRLPAVS